MRKPSAPKSRFLAIDLDVRSRRSLVPLAEAWPSSYQPIAPEGRAQPRWLILYPPHKRDATAESTAKEFVKRLELLPGNARRCWKLAHRRVFDIGVEVGLDGRAFEEVQLTAATLQRIAGLGASIQITVYSTPPVS